MRWKEKTMQKQSHRHLREEDRKIIYRMRKAGKTQQEIADVLGVSQGGVPPKVDPLLMRVGLGSGCLV